MATGMPQAFFPQPQVPALPRPYGPSPPSASTSQDEALWIGVYVVGGGVVAALGLVAYVAAANQKEHEEIRGQVGAADADLQSYKSRHAHEHAALAAEQDRLFARLQHQVNALYPETQRVMALPAPGTIYAEPAFDPPVAYSIHPSAPAFSYAVPSAHHVSSSYPFAPPTWPSAGVGPMSALTDSLQASTRAWHGMPPPSSSSLAPMSVPPPSSAFTSAPTAVPSSGMQKTFKMPRHLEDAVTRAMRTR